MLIRALTVAVLPFQNRIYSIAAASAFGNSFYAPAYLSSSPASRRRSLSLEKDTSAFANQCSIIPSLSLSLDASMPVYNRLSSLIKLRRIRVALLNIPPVIPFNAISRFRNHGGGNYWKEEGIDEIFITSFEARKLRE